MLPYLFVTDDDRFLFFFFLSLFLFIFQLLCVIVLSILCPLLFYHSYAGCLSSFLQFVRVCSPSSSVFFSHLVVAVAFLDRNQFLCCVLCICVSVAFPCALNLYLRSLSMLFDSPSLSFVFLCACRSTRTNNVPPHSF